MKFTHYNVKCARCHKTFNCVSEDVEDCSIEKSKDRICICPACYKYEDTNCKFLSDKDRTTEKVLFT